jgi:hypothetical protein
MQDMRDCYDSLLSAAAATANSAFEFSESLKEMGDCLLEKTALNEDEDTGKVLLMLGKVQFELQKLIDSYRSHIFQTITVPSESLLNELRIVEEMKRQCDVKRSGYEEMVTKHREKGRPRGGGRGGECYSSQQIDAAREDYDEDANAFVFRMKSLKRGQSRSLLTQAARHHAAQLRFFRKGLKSLETIEPHVKFVTHQHHIDYPFAALEDDDDDDDTVADDDDDNDTDSDNYFDESGNPEDGHDDGELSFDYRLNDQPLAVSASRDSMEVDNVEPTFPKSDTLKENRDKNRGGGYLARFNRGEVDLNKESSKSAPLLAEMNSNNNNISNHRESKKLHAYVLPTPAERRHTATADMYHSSPLEHKRYDKIYSGPILSTPQPHPASSLLRSTSRLPNPLQEGFSSPLLGGGSDSKKIKRYAFSGPLTPSWRASGAIQQQQQHIFSGSLLRTPLPTPQKSSFVSSPKISELHELPRPPPPAHVLVAHSAPLTARPLGQPSTLPAPPTSSHHHRP